MADMTSTSPKSPSVKSPGGLRQLAIYLTRDKLALCAAMLRALAGRTPLGDERGRSEQDPDHG